MDQGVRRTRERNPRAKASLLSIITFFYNYQLFKKGRKHELEEDDIYEVMPKFSSERLGDKLEYRWEKDKKHNDTPSLVRVLFRCFGRYYIFLGLIHLCMRVGMVLLQPKVFASFVAYFQKGQTAISNSDVYYFGFLVVFLNLVNCIYNHNYMQILTEFILRVRTSICSLIYRKALKLGPNTFSDISMGKTVTLLSKDVFSIDGALMFFNDMWIGLAQTAVISYILYQRIGPSVFAGVGFFILIVPLQVYVGKITAASRLATAKKTDERLQLTQETLSAIKIVKMYIWENYFGKIITEARNKETDKLKMIYYMKALILTLGALVLRVSFYLVIMTYIWTGHYVEAETVYFVQNCLFNLRSCMTISLPMGIAQTADCMAALQRIQKFLTSEELHVRDDIKGTIYKPKVYLKNVAVDIQGTQVLKSVSLNLEKGLLLITGNVGSGKSTLLKTILKDYPITSGELSVVGTISYAPEEPWLFPSTIRQNILFGQPYREKRYNEVLRICALAYDLSQFENGDNTIVGDRGINLSKGQQARISLARAVYKDSDIYLLDDCLSALDTHVNKHVFKHCINNFLKDKLCILVTYDINHMKFVSGRVLFVSNTGETLSLDQQNDSLDKRITYYMDEENERLQLEDNKDNNDNDTNADDETEKLLKNHVEKVPQHNLYHEEKKAGKVDISVYMRYYRYTGGIAVVLFMLLVFLLCQLAVSYSDKLVSLWVNVEPQITSLIKSNSTNTTEFIETEAKRDRILLIYSVMIFAATSLMLFRSYANFYFCTKAGRNLHKAMIDSIINAVMTFFDNHFIGNILNRLSKDFHTVDESLPFVIYENFRSLFTIVGIIGLIASVNWTFSIPAVFLLIKLYWIRNFYTPTGRSLRRLEAATRSPMIGYLNSTLEGLTTVRAYQQQETLKKEFDKHQDLYTSTFYMNQCTVRAFGFILDVMCVMFLMSIIGKFLIFPEGVNAGGVGLAVSQAMMLTGFLQYSIRQIAELENNMTSVERVLEYTDIETENKSGQEVENWPINGSIRYQNVSLTYKTTNERVLKNICFSVAGGNKIGIVGRTGAGKSSIISTLFRLYDIEGQIYIDGVDTKTLALDFMRSKIAIIPQDPVLFTGTIRSNIDPLEHYSDPEIWDAIEKVNMKTQFQSLTQRITEKGSNYSAGQRQLVCLARALVSKNKIIVLDEATANMDPETDALLQKIIQQHFSQCTVLTIAHRLHTVMKSDKVLVVDSGSILEYDAPQVLLKNSEGTFYKMVKEAGVFVEPELF